MSDQWATHGLVPPSCGWPMDDPWATTLNSWVNHGWPMDHLWVSTILSCGTYGRRVGYYIMGDPWAGSHEVMGDP